MEKKHREAIQKNFSSLVEQTDLDLMVSTLFEKEVFSDPMIEPYKDTSKDTRFRKRLLYRDIMRRGPHAFQHLLDALMENGYWGLVRDLDPENPLHPRPGPSHGGNSFVSISDKKRKNTGKEQEDPNLPIPPRPVPLPGDTPTPPPDEEPPINPNPPIEGPNKLPHFNVVMSTKFADDNGSDIKLYHTRGRFRGVLVLFSYVEFEHNLESYRNGALVDADNLKYLFTELGFKVLSYLNLSIQETRKTLEELKNGICGEGPETVFVVFSSHGYGRSGSGDTDIRCSDGHLISYFEIIDYFNNERFPALLGIPKVFIFQICRGSNKDIRAPRHLREPSKRRRRARTSPLYDEAGGGAGAARGGDDAAAGAARADARTERDGTVYDSDDSAASDDDADKRMYSDIIIANSTVPGYASSRDKELGSWYIQALCAVFAERAHERHVAELFTLVDERLRKRFRTQTSSVDYWGFNRHLYLHPGLYED